MPVAVQHDGRRHRVDRHDALERRGRGPVGVVDARVRHAERRLEGLRGACGVGVVDAQHVHALGRVVGGQGGEVGGLGAARRAVGVPGVEHDDVAEPVGRRPASAPSKSVPRSSSGPLAVVGGPGARAAVAGLVALLGDVAVVCSPRARSRRGGGARRAHQQSAYRARQAPATDGDARQQRGGGLAVADADEGVAVDRRLVRDATEHCRLRGSCHRRRFSSARRVTQTGELVARPARPRGHGRARARRRPRRACARPAPCTARPRTGGTGCAGRASARGGAANRRRRRTSCPRSGCPPR